MLFQRWDGGEFPKDSDASAYANRT